MEEESLAFRLSTPRDYFTYMGLMYVDYDADSDDAPALVPVGGGKQHGKQAKKGSSGGSSGGSGGGGNGGGSGGGSGATARWVTAAADPDDAARRRFRATARALLRKLVDGLPLDAVADQLCARLVQQRLPPFGMPPRPQPPLEELPAGAVLRCDPSASVCVLQCGTVVRMLARWFAQCFPKPRGTVFCTVSLVAL